MAEEQAGDSRTPFVIPSLSPLLGSKRATIIKGNGAAAQSLMQGLVLQLATMLPYGATFTLLDPSGAGRAFPMQRGLPFVRPVGADLARDLDAILEDIGRIIRSYLDAETQSFDALPEQIQANERYEFIVAANFPAGYDRRTIETLQKIAKNGPVAGKYVFLQMSSECELPRDLRWDDFGDMLTIDADNPPQVLDAPSRSPWTGCRRVDHAGDGAL
jgi:S-DNA-T family DNA segregation ATPase FtsK/SpoIIIE